MVLILSAGRKKFTLAKTCKIAYNSSMKFEKDSKMTEFEKQCYGISQATIEQEYCQSLTARLSGLEMVAMSVLSDAQELMSCNTAQTQNQARQHINIAKYILSKLMDDRLLAENASKVHKIHDRTA
jgi:hypothetical protein